LTTGLPPAGRWLFLATLVGGAVYAGFSVMSDTAQVGETLGGGVLMFLALALLIAALATWGLGLFWAAIGGGALPLHGWIAMGLGVAGTVGLTWGLMALAFKSHQEGWDERVDNTLDPGRDEPGRD